MHIFLLLFLFLSACGNPVFSSPPVEEPKWFAEFSRSAEEDKPRRKPDPAPSLSEKPAYVSSLEETVQPKKKSKKLLRDPIRKGPDLVPSGPALSSSQPAEEPADKKLPKPLKKADIVVVVDTSDSMRDFLRNVGSSFSGFIPTLAESVDYRIFFTNADHGQNGLFLFNGYALNGKAMPLEYKGGVVQNITYLSKRVRDHERIFLDTLRVHGAREFTYETPRGSVVLNKDKTVSRCHLPPYCGSWNEQPLKSLKSALVKNKEYFRPSADVVAIVISDSDEGQGLKSIKRTTAQDVVSAFNQAHKNKKLLFYGILMLDRECQRQYGKGWRDEDKFSFEISEMGALTAGANYSLCDTSYVPLARQIAVDL